MYGRKCFLTDQDFKSNTDNKLMNDDDDDDDVDFDDNDIGNG